MAYIHEKTLQWEEKQRYSFWTFTPTALPEEAKCVLAQSRLQSAEQPWESCSFTLQNSFSSPEKLGYQTWSNGSCLYPATSLTACAESLSQSKEAHPNIDKVVEFNVIHMYVQLEDNLPAGPGECPYNSSQI